MSPVDVKHEKETDVNSERKSSAPPAAGDCQSRTVFTISGQFECEQKPSDGGQSVTNECCPTLGVGGMRTRVRNFIGFWVLGLCNNYGYVIMLTAAFDLLSPDFHKDSSKDADDTAADGTAANETICNETSTGAVLLADILPALLTKLMAPFLMTNNIKIRVFIVILLSTASFILTSASVGDWMTFIGIVCASISSGLGEVTFLSFSALFDSSVVSGWSSGTGAAGLLGAGSYLVLTQFLSPRHTIIVMLVVPVIMTLTFWLLIVTPNHSKTLEAVSTRPLLVEDASNGASVFDLDATNESTISLQKEISFRKKLQLIKPLLKFMIPLGLVYFFEYFINQGLFELLYFPNIWIVHKKQYRVYQFLYQTGVFISRSSVNFFTIRKLWVLPVLQGVNFVIFLIQVTEGFMTSIWLVFAFVIFEGLLGGASYVNTFYRISKEVEPQYRSFSMGITSLADSLGIALSGVTAIPVHKALCKLLEP